MSERAGQDIRSSESTAPVPSVSVIVPTFREAQNLPGLVGRVEAVRRTWPVGFELLLVDDDSNDGTEQIVADLARPWVRLIVRKGVRGLSSAVLEGLRLARHEVALVMDGDLSHPPEVIPSLVQAIAGGADFALGSRYVEGGSTDATWGVFRWLNSRVATLMARPLTSVKDPMSGFFAIRTDKVRQTQNINPIGYKIALELLVRCRCRNVREIPIHFADRKLGQSKLSLAEQLRYMQHLRRLLSYKFFPDS